MELKEKEEKDEKYLGKLFKKKRCVSSLDFTPFRSQVKGKHSAGKDF